MYDFIVVGFGIAGMSVTYQLLSNGYKVLVIDNENTKASVVAAGMYNPVILKRFTLAWDAHNQLNYAKSFYKDLSVFLDVEISEDLNIYRKFSSIQEQNKWFSKLDNPVLSKYMNSSICNDNINGVSSPHGYGLLTNTGRINVKLLNQTFVNYLKNNNSFLVDEFDYNSLLMSDNVSYKNISSRNIIFSEGYHLSKNPFFNNLPLIGNKGSYITVNCPNLKLNKALKSFYFLIPLNTNGDYKFGATYQNKFSDTDHDQETKDHLIDEFKSLVDLPFTLIDQQTAVRPTVIDRRPLVGCHSDYDNMYILNGMGTRGIILAPTASLSLLNLIKYNTPLPPEIDIIRFKN